MGFMDLRDEGVPAGCESDLDATLTMMLLQYLFDKPGFQHNPSADTERNLYFGAHCTSATRMHGPPGPAERYALRSHAEAGWGCVPQVFFPADQKVTFAKYHSREEPPEMVIYSGLTAGCRPNPPCGGCRTNVEVKVDNIADASHVKSHHLCLCYGDHAEQLRTFCRMFGVQATA
jgi:L-fucose isomerase-like protein